MFLHRVILIISTLSVSSHGYETKIEWSLGSHLPVSKLLDSGTVQDLFCSVYTDTKAFPIILLCPLDAGICLQDCKSTNEISCSVISNHGKIIYHYTFTVFKSFEGQWICQYGSKTSRSLQLSVTDKPYIKSLIMTPNPVWKGSLMNITCQTMQMSGITGIQFQKVLEDNTTVSIPGNATYRIDQWTAGVIINSATPGRDDRIQCTVYTSNGIITTKILKTNVFDFPKNIILTSSAQPDKTHEIGSLISFQCSSDSNNPRPVLSLFHKRQNEPPKKMLDNNIILTKQDNHAHFYCELDTIAGRKAFLKSNTIMVIVNYPPENIKLEEEPKDQLMESQTKKLVCTSRGISEPPSHIEWSMVDSLGRKIHEHEVSAILESDQTDIPYKKVLLKSTVRMVMLRKYNRYSVTCSIIYQDKGVLSQTKTIRVAFAPNKVALNSNPLTSIPEGEKVVLTCFTESANPPPKIQWFKTEPGKKTEEITTHSNTDMIPGNFSGVAVSSTLDIHGPGRQNHGTLYKCVVTHAYITSEISKEYTLNVLFPPVIQIFSFPKQIEERDKVHLQCQTSGGNPSSIFQYNFQWGFCPVNISYQAPIGSDMSMKPPAEIRATCSHLSDSFSFHQNPILNISSITSKDRGWYSCYIRSPGGIALGYIFLDVLYSPVLTHITPSRIYAKPGSKVILNADLSSNPTNVNIKWYFRQNLRSGSKQYDQDNLNGNIPHLSILGTRTLLKNFENIKDSLLENYTIHLSINPITLPNYGDYFCEVTNKLGKKTLEFQVFPSDHISIPESNIRLQLNGRTVTVFYYPPTAGHFSHLVLRICPLQEAGGCNDMQISNPNSGQATITLTKSSNQFSYRLLVFNGSTLLQMTSPIKKNNAASTKWVETPIEMMIPVIIGVVGILVLLFVSLLALILLKCRHKKPKDNYLENNSVATTNSQQRRQDYMILNSQQNTSLLKNECHCFSNYPMELRSDNGSDHSVPSQNVYQAMVMRRKVRDNGEMSSIHSGGSCHSPDVVLTERTSINSSNNPMGNGPSYPYSIGNGSTKVTLLSGRLHPLDGQRQDVNMTGDFIMPQEMIFSAMDDGINMSQTRIIPIPKHMASSDYPVYLQMNNSLVPKPYDMTQPVLYTSPMPHCQNRMERNNQNSRENSSSTNTDSNHDLGNHNTSNIESQNKPIEKLRNDI